MNGAIGSVCGMNAGASRLLQTVIFPVITQETVAANELTTKRRQTLSDESSAIK